MIFGDIQRLKNSKGRCCKRSRNARRRSLLCMKYIEILYTSTLLWCSMSICSKFPHHILTALGCCTLSPKQHSVSAKTERERQQETKVPKEAVKPWKAGHPKNVKNKCHLNAFSQSLLWSPRAPKPATCGSTSWLSYNGYIRWNCETETKETKKHLQKSTKVKKLSGMDCAGCLQTDVLLSPSLHLMFPPK